MTASRYAFRIGFACYAAGLITWLVLGFLPTVGILDSRVAAMSPHMAAMSPVPAWEAVEQYAFSLLNLGLGLLLVARRPDEVVPRLLAVALLGTAATFNAPAHRAFKIIGTPLPVELIHFTFHVVAGVAYVWAVVLFSVGQPPLAGRLPRAARWVAAGAMTAAAGWVSWESAFYAHLQFFVIFFGIAVPVLGVGAQTLRLADTRAEPQDRRSARLLIGALLPSLTLAAVWTLARGAAALGNDGARTVATTTQEWFAAVFALVPVVLFAGVVRYRLWDIDRLVSRVLTYGAITVAVSALSVTAIVAGGRIIGGGLVQTVLVLAVIATLIEPLRLAGRRWANRVVYGQVLDPREANLALVQGLEQLTGSAPIDQLVAVACAATRATAAEVWLRTGAGWQRVAASDRPTPRPDTLPADADFGVPLWPIVYQGESLGVLALDYADAHPSRADVAVAEQIAAHAGLVLHNAKLTVRLAQHVVELEQQSADLQRARRRLITAQDAERYRLERDLHDGAQQALIAAIITAPVDPAGAAGALDMSRRALDELSSSGRPAVLDQRGLAAALADAGFLAERAGVEVAVDVDADGLDPEVETAVYFSCVEALQNVVKHAGARHAWLRVSSGGGLTTFEVSDDGRGIDLTDDSRGRVIKLGARLAVLGGGVDIQKRPAGGTVFRGAVPTHAAAAT